MDMESTFESIVSEASLKIGSDQQVFDATQFELLLNAVEQKIKLECNKLEDSSLISRIETYKLEACKVTDEIHRLEEKLTKLKEVREKDMYLEDEIGSVDDIFADASDPNSQSTQDRSNDTYECHIEDSVSHDEGVNGEHDDQLDNDISHPQLEKFRALRYSYREDGITLPVATESYTTSVVNIQISWDTNLSLLSVCGCTVSEFSISILQFADSICFKEYPDPSQLENNLKILLRGSQYRRVTGIIDFYELCDELQENTHLHMVSLYTELALISGVLCFVSERFNAHHDFGLRLTQLAVNISLFCDQTIMPTIEERMINRLQNYLLPSALIFPNPECIPLDEMSKILNRSMVETIEQIQCCRTFQKRIPSKQYMVLIKKITDYCYDLIFQTILTISDITVDWCNELSKNCKNFLNSTNSPVIAETGALSQPKVTKSEERLASLLRVLDSGLYEIANIWADPKSSLRRTVTCHELIDLITALFQETDTRREVISEIMNDFTK